MILFSAHESSRPDMVSALAVQEITTQKDSWFEWQSLPGKVELADALLKLVVAKFFGR